MRWLARILVVVAVLAVAAAGAAWLVLERTLPKVDGEITLAGIGGPIEVVRDAAGVPHVFAATERDAYFALGFVHAQDRLWQMELARHAAAGRLGELFGTLALPHDRYFRTLGFGRVAARIVDTLPAAARALLDAYAAGVSAYIASHRGPPGVEFALLGQEPAPWRPEDSILVVKIMATDLAGNAAGELLRAKLASHLSAAQVAALWPPYPGDQAPPPPGHAALDEELVGRALALLPPARPPGIGSNNWAVAPGRSASGAAILANDPHLGLAVPAVWYLAHLHADGLDVVGGTIPGIPAVIVGRNRSLAWGVTNTGPDAQDMFVVADDDTLTARTETIALKGADAVDIVVRESPFGPIVSDATERYAAVTGGRALALSWTALETRDDTVQAAFALARARTVDDGMAALADFDDPQQNFLLADGGGHIGFVAAGRVPVRAGTDGWTPTDASGGGAGWRGYLPYDALPRARDPQSGVLFTANQRIVPDDYPSFITRDWAEPYRARRIAEMLAARERHSVADFMAMQTDIVSLAAREMLPLLLAVPLSARGERLRPQLAAWDSAMAADRPEPLIFHAWLRALMVRLLADELGDDFAGYQGHRPLVIEAILDHDHAWCDDVRTDAAEDCPSQVAAALDDALDWLEARYGADPARWRWGAAHQATSRHALLSSLPVIGGWFGVVRAHGGGPHTVMQANTRPGDAAAPFAEVHGASLRAIFDLADPDSTRLIVHAGQSGHWWSRHYDDLADRWAAGAYLTVPLGRAAVEAAAAHRLTLRPAS
ncbi:MAG TPA: penicillin acylase family protein [Alphaproteobacteria bacterium]